MFGVLGPVTATGADGSPVALRGPMHRALLARLLIARGRAVPLQDLIDDLWVAPPAGAVPAVRTFVAALRRALEPERAPRTPPALLVTRGTGYALTAAPGDVDAWRFEQAVTAAATLDPASALARIEEALAWWRGPAYADFLEVTWTRTERARLTELRSQAAERRARARLDLGRPGEAIPDLDEHVAEQPWREEGWRLLALALYRAGRQADALAVLRRARDLLAGQLGLEPGPALRTLETGILRQSPDLDPAAEVWTRAAAAYDRLPGGTKVRLASAVGLLRNLAVTGPGGLVAAREQRAAAVAAAEQLGDPELTARVIGAYDVPAIWTRADDPEQSAAIVAAASRALASAPPPAARARLLATIAVESRGTGDRWARECALEAEGLARSLEDPGLLAFALNGVFMQSCHRTGQAPARGRIGRELIELGDRHGLGTVAVLGHLVAMQAQAAVAGWTTADGHAAAIDALVVRHELPLAGVFTQWYRALRADVASSSPVDDLYRSAAERSDQAGMPGLSEGLLSLARLGSRLRRGSPLLDHGGWGPYEPWVRPVLSPGEALPPDPPADLLAEALWTLTARAAIEAGDRAAMTRARDALTPAAGEWAGAASGLLTFGPVSDHLQRLTAALGDRP